MTKVVFSAHAKHSNGFKNGGKTMKILTISFPKSLCSFSDIAQRIIMCYDISGFTGMDVAVTKEACASSTGKIRARKATETISTSIF